METITIHPTSKEQTRLFEQLAKVLNVPFEKKKTESSYNPEFVREIKEADKEFNQGKGHIITMDELEKLCK